MKIIPTKLKDVVLLEPHVFGDHRGYFVESYNKKVMEKLGITIDFIQDNQSKSTEAGTLRGLHFQVNPKAQVKLVRCVSGAIYDVVVDIRIGSPTYGHWIGVILSADNHRQLLVPKGFAHGLCTLVPDTVIAYKVDEYYCPKCDGGILWNDPNIGITWPVTNPILSEKDLMQPTLEAAELNFVYEGGEEDA